MEHWDRKVSQFPTRRSKNMEKQLIQTFLVSKLSRICKMLIKGTLCLESRKIATAVIFLEAVWTEVA
jgi:hypothetical protein